ncbi:hypothetical protein ACTXT7_008553 [Hymenolepis weldensis]
MLEAIGDLESQSLFIYQERSYAIQLCSFVISFFTSSIPVNLAFFQLILDMGDYICLLSYECLGKKGSHPNYWLNPVIRAQVRKQPTMSILISKSASPHLSESQAKIVKYKATNLTSVSICPNIPYDYYEKQKMMDH